MALGPNIKYTGGRSWDFRDHRGTITEQSLAEVLPSCGFNSGPTVSRFLPFTMSDGYRYPIMLLRICSAMPMVWPLLGTQVLVKATKQ